MEVKEGKDLGEMEGTRKLIFTILQSALYDAEDKEKALVEIFRAMRDCTVKKEMGEQINHWEIMEMLTRDVDYMTELQPIDVVRQVMQMWIMWGMEEEWNLNAAEEEAMTTEEAVTTEA